MVYNFPSDWPVLEGDCDERKLQPCAGNQGARNPGHCTDPAWAGPEHQRTRVPRTGRHHRRVQRPTVVTLLALQRHTLQGGRTHGHPGGLFYIWYNTLYGEKQKIIVKASCSDR